MVHVNPTPSLAMQMILSLNYAALAAHYIHTKDAMLDTAKKSRTRTPGSANAYPWPPAS